MIPSAKTIQIYLPKGNPRGLRLAEMTTRTVRLIEIPRIHIDDFFAMPDANQVGLYFLIGEKENTDKPLLYIGQTGDLKRRLSQHDDKDFWTRAFVMLSTNNTMTQTHALYMEHKAITTATQVGRYEIKNGNTGNKPHTPDPLRADCEELFYTLNVLLSTLGQPIFESLSIKEENTDKSKLTEDTVASFAQDIEISTVDTQPMLFYCATNGAEAKGYYDDDGFVILTGSRFRKNAAPSLSAWGMKTRASMIQEQYLVDYSEQSYQLRENYLCKTPSGAAQIVLGRPSNGWIEWTNIDGKTLSEIYR
ncbi:GIY-YIG nuclease family protein [uncultured Psychrobacter sp.]|uniref:GIY-YIG nuclease family protein n=1 Tax=uncultured Psychrobacter sp. TaxID=259303 RepID=UPI003457C3FC